MPFLRRLAFILIGCAVVLAAAILFYQRYVYESKADEKRNEFANGPRVHTAIAKAGASTRQLTLLGEARPYADVTLYAKVSGYLREMNVDAGDIVKKGQVIARISSQELDKNYSGATADAHNKRAIANRLNSLKQRNLISAQEAEQAQAEALVAESNRDSSGALKSYQTIIAPFDGVVTQRFADVGALVQSAANSQASALPIVRISDVSRLRVAIYIDQKDAIFVKPGDPVQITVDESPNIIINAKISRVSGKLDSQTRMLEAEIDLDNTKKKLLPGSYLHVDLKAKTQPLLEVPVEALVYQQNKSQVGVIENNVLTYRDIVIHKNDGKMVQIASGLKEGEVVAISIGTSLGDKSRVQPIVPQK